jgi:hypothetical protein
MAESEKESDEFFNQEETQLDRIENALKRVESVSTAVGNQNDWIMGFVQRVEAAIQATPLGPALRKAAEMRLSNGR